jgi:hypothetical protein
VSTTPLWQRRSNVVTNYGLTNRLLASWQARRLIPFVKVGRKTTLFKTEDIENFLKKHTVKTQGRAGADGGAS